jgi:hypothetical protein
MTILRVRSAHSYAAAEGHEAVVQLLIDRGANFEIPDKGSKPPQNMLQNMATPL